MLERNMMVLTYSNMQIYPNVPQGVAWNGNNIGGSTKRGVGIAMHVGFGNLGGAIAGYVFWIPFHLNTANPFYHIVLVFEMSND